MRPIIRETVTEPATPPVMWGQEELNMPPASWFRGMWYPEIQRLRRIEAAERARQEKKERIITVLKNLGYSLLGAGVIGLYFLGLYLIGPS